MLYRNITSGVLTTPSGQDWPAGEVAQLPEDKARSLLAYRQIEPVIAEVSATPAPAPEPEQSGSVDGAGRIPSRNQEKKKNANATQTGTEGKE